MKDLFIFNKLFASFIRSWKYHTVMNATTLIVLTGSFAIIMGAFVIYKNLNQVIVSWSDKVQVSIYLEDEIVEKDVKDIENIIKAEGEISKYSYVSKMEAMKMFKTQMSQMNSDLFLEDEDFNPLPASFEASIRPTVSNKIEYLKNLSAKLNRAPGVEDVSYGQGWVKTYSALVNSVTQSGLTIIITLVFGSILVIGNSIRSSVYQRVEEIKIMELVGATQGMVRTPFVFEGALMGLIASVFALVLAGILTHWQSNLITKQFGILELGQGIQFLSVWQGLFFVLLGTLFGALGSYVCVQQINSGWSNSSENI